MAHDTNKEQIVAYLMNEMDETERAAFEATLKADSNTHELLAQLRAAADIAAEALGQIAPEDLVLSEVEQEGILREARRGHGGPLVPDRPQIRKTSFRPMRVLLVAASIAVVMVAGALYLVYEPQWHGRWQEAHVSNAPDTKRQQEVIDTVRKLTGEQGPMTFEEAESKLLSTIKAPPAPSDPSAPQSTSPANDSEEYVWVTDPLSGYACADGPVLMRVPKSTVKEREGHIYSEGTFAPAGTSSSVSPSAARTNTPSQSSTPKHKLSGYGHLLPPGDTGYASDDVELYQGYIETDLLPERRGRLNVKADFTSHVDGHIVLDENVWTTSSNTSVNNEAYGEIVENVFLAAAQEPLSTFSTDVDTASYSNVRRYINEGQMPPKDAVRIEELVNYFSYDYAPPQSTEDPFAAHIEIAACPWKSDHRIARIGLKGREIPEAERRPANLVFLLDVSGSMDHPNKLSLVKQAMQLLVERLSAKDRVAIVVYAGSTGLFLSSTPGDKKDEILEAIARLTAGGSTNGAGGIQLAYETAEDTFLKDGTNRVILATDGDFNVGITDRDELVKLIEDEAKTGVFLNVLGFGMGNLKDATLEQLADKGNGTYAYVDSFSEARKIFSEQLSGTLTTIAKDVKIQVEFNPSKVQAYRLIGYENRVLAAQDFNDDKKDAGEIGAGHTVTALYELVPPGVDIDLPTVDPLKYQPQAPAGTAGSDEWFTLKIRYKQPDGDESKLLAFPARDTGAAFDAASPDLKFASAVAAFGMLLRESQYKGSTDYRDVVDWAESGLGADASGYRKDFLQLVREAKRLAS